MKTISVMIKPNNSNYLVIASEVQNTKWGLKPVRTGKEYPKHDSRLTVREVHWVGDRNKKGYEVTTEIDIPDNYPHLIVDVWNGGCEVIYDPAVEAAAVEAAAVEAAAVEAAAVEAAAVEAAEAEALASEAADAEEASERYHACYAGVGNWSTSEAADAQRGVIIKKGINTMKMEKPKPFTFARDSEWGIQLEPSIKVKSWRSSRAFGPLEYSKEYVEYDSRPPLGGDWWWSCTVSSPTRLWENNGYIWLMNALPSYWGGVHEYIRWWGTHFSGFCWDNWDAANQFRTMRMKSDDDAYHAWKAYKLPSTLEY